MAFIEDKKSFDSNIFTCFKKMFWQKHQTIFECLNAQMNNFRNKAICRNMDRPRDYHTKWSKSEKDKYCMAPLICKT